MSLSDTILKTLNYAILWNINFKEISSCIKLLYPGIFLLKHISFVTGDTFEGISIAQFENKEQRWEKKEKEIQTNIFYVCLRWGRICFKSKASS